MQRDNKEPAPRVLVIDDSEEQVRLLNRVLTRDGYECVAATTGRRGLELASSGIDVVLLDIMLPDTDGLTVCRDLKARPETALIPVLIMTGRLDDHVLLDALNAGADDFLPKPLRLLELMARLRSAARMKQLVDELDDAAASIVMLGATIEARDRYTNGHCQRLAQYGSALGARIGLNATDVRALERGGFLHDLGKIAVPDAILFKPGPLTTAEFDVIKSHPGIGERLCAPLRSLDRVRPIIRHHHERLDGSGYPDGLRGSAVPLLAQITSIVDAYDALTTDRPYRGAFSSEAAFEVLWNEVGAGRRDGALVQEFAGLVPSMPVPGELVASA